MSYRVLISAPYMLREREKVQQLLDPHDLNVTWAIVKERLEENDLLECIADYDGVLCGDDRITERVLSRAAKLKTIVKWGTGIDSIDQAAAAKRGVSLYRTPGAFTEPVSDTTLALILSFARGISRNDSILKAGGWDKPQGFALFETVVGIIGYGTIGQAVAKRLQVFGPKIIAYDIAEKDPALARAYGVTMVSKEEVLENSDFITLHCDLNPTSYRILDAKAFSTMRRKPVIFNTARGPVIDESALIQALQSGQVAGAGLDVFEHEPLPLGSPLRSLGNVLLSSHNSNSSPASWDRVHKESIQMLIRGLNGR